MSIVQVETQVLRDAMLKLKPLKVYIAVHTYGMRFSDIVIYIIAQTSEINSIFL